MTWAERHFGALHIYLNSFCIQLDFNSIAMAICVILAHSAISDHLHVFILFHISRML